jgi:hypothetical protein
MAIIDYKRPDNGDRGPETWVFWLGALIFTAGLIAMGIERTGRKLGIWSSPPSNESVLTGVLMVFLMVGMITTALGAFIIVRDWLRTHGGGPPRRR